MLYPLSYEGGALRIVARVAGGAASASAAPHGPP